ncbi:MAG: cobalamin-binding protein [Burkholderiales bacterium]
MVSRAGILFAFVFCAIPAGASAQQNDRSGRLGRLTTSSERIVTLAPFLAELVYAAGAGDKLVAVSSHSDYPAEAKNKPVIGDASAIDMERLVALKPDLVIAWTSGGHPAATRQLTEFGMQVFQVNAEHIADIPRLLRSIGELAGTQAAADDAAEKFDQRLASLRQRYAANPRQKAFFEIWHNPLITVNGKHYISEAMEICGGRNIFSSVAASVPTVGLESIYAANPQVILSSTSTGDADAKKPWLAHRKLQAVKRGNIFALDPDLIQRQTPRLLDGVESICRALEGASRTTFTNSYK